MPKRNASLKGAGPTGNRGLRAFIFIGRMWYEANVEEAQAAKMDPAVGRIIVERFEKGGLPLFTSETFSNNHLAIMNQEMTRALPAGAKQTRHQTKIMVGMVMGLNYMASFEKAFADPFYEDDVTRSQWTATSD